jgi:hypothetical protein
MFELLNAAQRRNVYKHRRPQMQLRSEGAQERSNGDSDYKHLVPIGTQTA